MTKTELRIAIAKDVIKSLRRITPTTGVYVGTKNDAKVQKIVELNKGDSKKIAEKVKSYCEVCALGACFISAVAVDNKWDFEEEDITDSYTDTQLSMRLSKIFTPSQMGLIEAAFECCNRGVFSNILDKRYDAAVAFGEQYKTPRSRLKAIMENIIENDGIFNP